jgi:hypothetical protein
MTQPKRRTPNRATKVTISELLAPTDNQAFLDVLVDEHNILASQGLVLVSADSEGHISCYYRGMTGFTTIGVLTLAINGLIDG